MIFRGSQSASPSETSVACRRMIRKATSEWRAKIFLCLLPFLKNRSCVCGEIDPQIAAQEYEDQLTAIATESGQPIYQHDLILLGLGDDGHTASLFPGTAALDEMTRRVVANFVPKLNAWRLTFTFPLINHARHILFLVGASKSPQLIERVLAGDQQFPAARVNPSAGELTWMIAE